jgi:hypothetical protein
VTAGRLFAGRSTSSDISPGGARLDVTNPILLAFRACKDDADERLAERHRRTSVICIRREQALRQFLVARSVGIESAALRSVSSVRGGTDGSSADAYRHSTAYGCATVNSAAISAAVIDASAANTSAPTAICERIS